MKHPQLSRWLFGAAVACLAALGSSAAIHADPSVAAPTPPAMEGVGIRPQLQALLPMNTTFRDESGKTVQIGDYFKSGRPVILNLMFFRCTALCNPALRELTSALAQMPPDWTAGGKFDVLTVSFDPLEDPSLAAGKKKSVMAAYDRPGAEAGWHFLTGDEKNIKALTDSVGFYYRWSDQTNQFAHDVAQIVISPEGKVTHYLRSLTYDPTTIRLALIDSAAGKIGSVSDRFALFACYGFDPVTGKYQVIAFKLVRFAGAAAIMLTVALVGMLVLVARRRRRLMANSAPVQPAWRP
jgi:protein SCO1